MLIVRAPLRISLAGGGTDLPGYYSRFGGAVLSTSINKYFYVLVTETGAGYTQVISADLQTFFHASNSPEPDYPGKRDLSLPSTIFDHFGYHGEEQIFIASEVPPGTGLGSSSAVTVGLIKAISVVRHEEMSKQAIAELASYIEIEKLGAPIGKQDQYASAFGGLNLVRFEAENVTVEPLQIKRTTFQKLEGNLMLFYTGVSRKANSILSQQKASTDQDDPQVLASLHAIKQAALDLRHLLENDDVDSLGAFLDENWQRKKKLSKGITNETIDAWYNLARQNGALGGKIAGAGGGGFLLLFCPQDAQECVKKTLAQAGLRYIGTRFEQQGVHVVLNSLTETN